jgi:dihydrofolate reductase
MRKVIMQIELTLDGFYAGPNEEFDWFTLDPEAWQFSFGLLSQIDSVLLGRKNYEGFASYWPTVATNPEASETDLAFSRWLDAVPKVVFSKTLDKVEWKNSRLIKDNLAEEVAKLKAQPGKDILIMNSASVAQACIQHGLLDEYWLTMHPVTLGSGLALFKDRVNLKLLSTKVFDSGQVFVHYATPDSAEDPEVATTTPTSLAQT